MKIKDIISELQRFNQDDRIVLRAIRENGDKEINYDFDITPHSGQRHSAAIEYVDEIYNEMATEIEDLKLNSAKVQEILEKMEKEYSDNGANAKLEALIIAAKEQNES